MVFWVHKELSISYREGIDEKLKSMAQPYKMKVLQKAKKEGELLDIKFDNIEYFTFDVTNRDIANSFDVLYQTTLLIFKGDTEVYRSIGETTEDLIYEALKASI